MIPVEVVGGTIPEADETFYLDVSNPVGDSFGSGVLTLTAVRTIVNDAIVCAASGTAREFRQYSFFGNFHSDSRHKLCKDSASS